ncbi:hypothetical protein ZHAS_00012889 [Anopheles sinensis]|uniref:Uncharacterized protein n=1 Tax=Anopheles sinensis TaxID=74873 RepID=A0A084W4B8_ANOSI|nr:hypothetical protein ZHAS_00012889 [Anopheles sinensis]
MASFSALGALLIALLAVLSNAQRGTVLPASEFNFGSFTNGATICYANSAVTQGHRLTPASRTFTFVPTTAQMLVRYIQLISTDGQKFYAQIVNGGVGTANPASTDILVTAVHKGNLSVLVRIYCGA